MEWHQNQGWQESRRSLQVLPKGFDDAVKVGFARATKTLRGITGMRMVEFRVAVENSKIVEYRVRMEVIFVLET